MKYDVVIVGGGPAGATAVKWMAKRGVRVLLVEKNSDFAVKACAEGVTNLAFEAMGISPSEKIRAFRISGAWLYPPEASNAMYVPVEKVNLSGYVVDKRLLLRELVFEGMENGADVLMNAYVVDFLKKDGNKFSGVIVSRNGEYIKIHSKIVIVCDGVTGISRVLIGRNDRTLEPAYQYTMANVLLNDNNSIHIFFGRKYAPLGYLWIFPKDINVANVGLGARGVNLRDYLNKFIFENPSLFKDSSIIKVNAGVIDLSGQIDDPVMNGLMICGEAAGHVVPITGEGIGPSAVAGKIAGEVAVEALESNDFSKGFLKKYVQRFRSHRYSKMINVGLKARLLFENLDDKDLNNVFRILEPDDFIGIFNGDRNSYLQAMVKLLKSPAMMFKIAQVSYKLLGF
ncbi:MAG: NAD(P)/FAD-dependent oxidoreductase [Thermoprotei archaeon]